MEFTIELNELSASFIYEAVHSFRKQHYGNYPTRILLSHKNTIKVCYEIRNLMGVSAGLQPPYKIYGINVFRCLDIEENKLELY